MPKRERIHRGPARTQRATSVADGSLFQKSLAVLLSCSLLATLPGLAEAAQPASSKSTNGSATKIIQTATQGVDLIRSVTTAVSFQGQPGHATPQYTSILPMPDPNALPGAKAAAIADAEADQLSQDAHFYATGANPFSPDGQSVIAADKLGAQVYGQTGGQIVAVSPEATVAEYQSVQNLPQVLQQAKRVSDQTQEAVAEYVDALNRPLALSNDSLYRGEDGLAIQQHDLSLGSLQSEADNLQQALANAQAGSSPADIDALIQKASQNLSAASNAYAQARDALIALSSSYEYAAKDVQQKLALLQKTCPASGSPTSACSVVAANLQSELKGLQNAQSEIKKQMGDLQKVYDKNVSAQQRWASDIAKIRAAQAAATQVAASPSPYAPSTGSLNGLGSSINSLMDRLEGFGKWGTGVSQEVMGVGLRAVGGGGNSAIAQFGTYMLKNGQQLSGEGWAQFTGATPQQAARAGAYHAAQDELDGPLASSIRGSEDSAMKVVAPVGTGISRTSLQEKSADAERLGQNKTGNLIELAKERTPEGADRLLAAHNDTYSLNQAGMQKLHSVSGYGAQLKAISQGRGSVSDAKSLVDKISAELGNGPGKPGDIQKNILDPLTQKNSLGFYTNPILEVNREYESDMQRQVYAPLLINTDPRTQTQSDIMKLEAFNNYVGSIQNYAGQEAYIQSSFSDLMPKPQSVDAQLAQGAFQLASSPFKAVWDMSMSGVGTSWATVGKYFNNSAMAQDGTTFAFAHDMDLSQLVPSVLGKEAPNPFANTLNSYQGFSGIHFDPNSVFGGSVAGDWGDSTVGAQIHGSWVGADGTASSGLRYDPNQLSVFGTHGVWTDSQGNAVDSGLQGVMGKLGQQGTNDLTAVMGQMSVENLSKAWLKDSADNSDFAGLLGKTVALSAYKAAETATEMAGFGLVQGGVLKAAGLLDGMLGAGERTALAGFAEDAAPNLALGTSMSGSAGATVGGLSGALKTVTYAMGQSMQFHFVDSMLGSVADMAKSPDSGQLAYSLADFAGNFAGMGAVGLMSAPRGQGLGAAVGSAESIVGQMAGAGAGAVLGGLVGLPAVGEIVGISLQEPAMRGMGGMSAELDAARSAASALSAPGAGDAVSTGLALGLTRDVLERQDTETLQAMKAQQIKSLDLAPESGLSRLFGGNSERGTGVDTSNPLVQAEISKVLADREAGPVRTVSDALRIGAQGDAPLDITGASADPSSPGFYKDPVAALSTLRTRSDEAYASYRADPNDAVKLDAWQKASQQEAAARLAIQQNANLASAVSRGPISAFERLLHLGAPTPSSNIKDALKETPLRLAELQGQEGVVRAIHSVAELEGKPTSADNPFARQAADVEVLKAKAQLEAIRSGLRSRETLAAQQVALKAQADLSRAMGDHAENDTNASQKERQLAAQFHANADYLGAQANLIEAKLNGSQADIEKAQSQLAFTQAAQAKAAADTAVLTARSALREAEGQVEQARSAALSANDLGLKSAQASRAAAQAELAKAVAGQQAAQARQMLVDPRASAEDQAAARKLLSTADQTVASTTERARLYKAQQTAIEKLASLKASAAQAAPSEAMRLAVQAAEAKVNEAALAAAKASAEGVNAGLLSRAMSSLKMATAKGVLALQLTGLFSGAAAAAPLGLNAEPIVMADVPSAGERPAFTFSDQLKLRAAQQRAADTSDALQKITAVDRASKDLGQLKALKSVSEEIASRIESLQEKLSQGQFSKKDAEELSVLEQTARRIESRQDGVTQELLDAQIEKARAGAMDETVPEAEASQVGLRLAQARDLADSSFRESEARAEAAQARLAQARAEEDAARDTNLFTRTVDKIRAQFGGWRADRLDAQAEQKRLDEIQFRADEEGARLKKTFAELRAQVESAPDGETLTKELAGRIAATAGQEVSVEKLTKSSRAEMLKRLNTALAQKLGNAKSAAREDQLFARIQYAARHGDRVQLDALIKQVESTGAGRNDAARQYARDMRELVGQTMPAQKAILFDRMFVGRQLYDEWKNSAGQPDEEAAHRAFLDWTQRENVGFSKGGFIETWNSEFGEPGDPDISLEKARASLTSQLGGEDPQAFVARMEDRLWNALVERGVIPKRPEDFKGTLTDYLHAALKAKEKGDPEAEKLLGDLGKLGEEYPLAADNVHNALEALLDNATLPERAALSRLLADAVLSANFFDTRVAQEAALTIFADGKNPDVDPGGGKTETAVIDQAIHSVIGGKAYNGEISAQNAADADKFVNERSVRAIAKAFGLEVVDITRLQREPNIQEITDAYNNANNRRVIKITDPTTRGHLMNEAFGDASLRKALQAPTVVTNDEGHLVVTGKTSAVRGRNLPVSESHPSDALVAHVRQLFNQLQPYIPSSDAVRPVESAAAKGQRLKELNDPPDGNPKRGVIVFKGEPIVSNALMTMLRSQGFSEGDVYSVAKALVTEAGKSNSYWFGPDEKTGNSIVFPVDEYGVHQADQINSNTVEDIARVLKYKDDPRFKHLNLDPKSTVRIQSTDIETPLSAVYENDEALRRATSGTFKGLERLTTGRIGSQIVNVSGAELDLDELVTRGDSARNLGKGLILQAEPGFADLDLNKINLDPKGVQHDAAVAALLAKMDADLAKGNLVIATENPNLIRFFQQRYAGANVIDGETANDEVSKLAGMGRAEGGKDLTGKVLILGRRAFTGTNIQLGKVSFYALEVEKIPEQTLIQLLKRVNRPGPSEANLTGGRWAATRNLVLTNKEALSDSLQYAREHSRELLDPEMESFNGRAKKLLNDLLEDKQLSLKGQIELGAFARQAYVNSEAGKFAIQDVLRDRYVIQPLKNALAQFAPGSREHAIMSEVLQSVLSRGRADYMPVSEKDYAQSLSRDDFLKQTFQRVEKEAQSVIDRVAQRMPARLSRNAGARERLNNWLVQQRGRLVEFSAAAENYKQIPADKNLSFAKATSGRELVSAIKSVAGVVLDGHTAVNPTNREAAVAASRAWNEVQKAVRAAQRANDGHPGDVTSIFGGRPGQISLAAAHRVWNAVNAVTVAALPNGVEKRVFSQVLVANSLTEVQAALQHIVRQINTSPDGRTVLQAPVQSGSEPGLLRQAVEWVSDHFSGRSLSLNSKTIPPLVNNLASLAMEGDGTKPLQGQALNRLAQMMLDGRTSTKASDALTRVIGKYVWGGFEDPAELKTAVARLSPLVLVALNAPSTRPEWQDGFTVRRVVKNGKLISVSMKVDEMTAGAVNEVSSLITLSQLLQGLPTPVEIPIHIVMPPVSLSGQNAAERQGRVKDMIEDANRDGARLFVAEAGSSQAARLGTNERERLVSARTTNPLRWLGIARSHRRASVQEDAATALVGSVNLVAQLEAMEGQYESALAALEAATSNSDKAKLEKQVARLENKVSALFAERDRHLWRLRLMAPQLARSANAVLSEHLPANVLTLLNDLARAQDNDAAQAAIDRYRNAAGDEEVAQRAPMALPVNAPAITFVNLLNEGLLEALGRGYDDSFLKEAVSPQALEAMRGNLDAYESAVHHALESESARIRTQVHGHARAQALESLNHITARINEFFKSVREDPRVSVRVVARSLASTSALAHGGETIFVLPDALPESAVSDIKAAYPKMTVVSSEIYGDYLREKALIHAEGRRAALTHLQVIINNPGDQSAEGLLTPSPSASISMPSSKPAKAVAAPNWLFRAGLASAASVVGYFIWTSVSLESLGTFVASLFATPVVTGVSAMGIAAVASPLATAFALLAPIGAWYYYKVRKPAARAVSVPETSTGRRLKQFLIEA